MSLVMLPGNIAINPEIIIAVIPIPGKGVLLRARDSSRSCYVTRPEWGENPSPNRYWKNPKITMEMAIDLQKEIVDIINQSFQDLTQQDLKQ